MWVTACSMTSLTPSVSCLRRCESSWRAELLGEREAARDVLRRDNQSSATLIDERRLKTWCGQPNYKTASPAR